METYCNPSKAGKLTLKEKIEAALLGNPGLELPFAAKSLQSMSDGDLQAELAGYRLTFWGRQPVLNVHFIRGVKTDHDRVKLVVEQWEQLANVWFTFDEHKPSDLRVGFMPKDGNWSALGTEAKSPAYSGKQTMNLANRDLSGQLEESTILHEFGHALGFYHEHQHPQCSLNWIEANVIKDLSGPPNNWDEATIRFNMFGKQPQYNFVFGPYDQTSIMHYKIPAHWHTGAYAIPWNLAISAEDKKLVQQVYPFTESGIIDAAVTEKTYRVRTGDTVVCIPVMKSAQGKYIITFGDPTNTSGHIYPGQDEEIDLVPYFTSGSNQVNLRLVQRGQWNAAYRLFINGAEVPGSPFAAQGDSWIPMHAIANLFFMYK